MADWRDCIASIRSAAGHLSDEEIDDIITRLGKRREKLMRDNPTMSEGEALVQAAASLGDESRLSAVIEKRSRTINVLRKRSNIAYIDGTFPTTEAKGLQALIVGLEGRDQGAGFSQDAQAKGILSGYLGPMVGEMRKAGLLGIFAKGTLARASELVGLGRDSAAAFRQFQRDVARELWRIDDPEAPASNNPKAEQAAKIIRKYQELARQQQNDAGAWIGKLPGYIVRQSHDQLRVAGRGTDADFARWRDAILPKLDEGKTFEGVDNPAQFLRETWLALATGLHDRPGGDWLGGFKGPGNLAKRVSQERVLHFKSADDWFEYNEQYGSGSTVEAVVHGFSQAARNLAALRVWGTNPEAAFVRLRDEMATRARDRGDIAGSRQIQGHGLTGDYLGRQFKAANGQLGIPENPTLARIGSHVRAGISMAKLGGVVLSSFPDIHIAASVLKHNGQGLLERYGNAVFGTILRGPLDGAAREAADITGAALDGIIGSMVNRYSATDHSLGRMSKLQDIFFRLNGLTFWTDRMKEGVSLGLARGLALRAGQAFENLDPRLKITLDRYGLGGQTWDVIRRGAAEAEDGRSYLLPDLIDRLSDDDMQELSRATDPDGLARARVDLGIKLRSYFAEQTRDAMTESGAKERAFQTGGYAPGTIPGELWRFMFQFKAFNSAMLSRQVGREIFRAPDTQGRIVNIASLIVGTTILGALANAAKDLSKGRNPRPWGDPATWKAAMLQGGGLGIYGDFLFGTSNRFGQSLVETLAGPAIGDLSDLKRVLDAAAGQITGQTKADARPMAARFLINNTPFLNLFYTRAALDYFFLYSVQEALNPGFLRRYEQNVKRNTGQTFWLRPTQAVR